MPKAIHTMIRVLDLDRSIDFYGKAFGLGVADNFDFDGFALVYLRNDEADFEIELTLNKVRTEPYTHGDGYGHVACVLMIALPNTPASRTLGLSPRTSRNSIVTAP